MSINPYSDQDFFGFFATFFSRLFHLVTGRLSWGELVSDEIQIVVLSLVAATGALVGTFLILRRMVMLANALSHTILLGIVVAFLLCDALTLPILIIAALITGVATTFLTDYLNRVIKLQEDASIGLIFSIFFALGIVLLTLFSRDVHLGTELVMGNVDALQRGDMTIVAAVLGINALLFLLLYYGFKITTFDPNLARAFGFSPIFFNYLLMVQTSSAAVGAFKAVGVLMVMAFFVLPTLTARLLTHKLSTLIALSAAIGVGASLCGVALSRHILTFWGLGLSTAGIVVMVLGGFYLCVIVIRWVDISVRARYHPISKTIFEKDEKNCTLG
jgi:manganese/zinc/iron transport system permease protein